jgi:predicted O-linked N-acetylglucosamine transferase (SPINDLY family)
MSINLKDKIQQINQLRLDELMALADEYIAEYKNSPEMILALSKAFHAAGKHHESRKYAKLCIANNKLTLNTLFNLARHLVALGLIAESVNLVEIAFRKVSNKLEIKHLSTALYVAIHANQWNLIKKLTKKIEEQYANNNYELVKETPRTHLLWCEDQHINNQVLNHFADQNFKEHSKKNIQLLTIENRKIRVGYMSSDYRNHPTSQLIKGLIKNHNRDKFEIIAYDTGFDDASDLRKEILGYFDSVEILFGLSDEDAARKVKQSNLDILVELNGLTSATKMGLMGHRLAPIQIGYLGFPGTVGGRFVDYIIADKYVIPDKYLDMYREKIIRIEKTYQVNDYPINNGGYEAAKNKNDMGFSNDAFIMGMFNNSNKITEQCWRTWMKIMETIPNAILWILRPNDYSIKNLLEVASEYKFNSKRIIFAPRLRREQHYERLAICDLVLDPWPYGGHTTTADALYVGVPVLTKTGENFPSRVSGGLLMSAGLPGWIVEDQNAYIEAAFNLYKNPKLLEMTKKYLRENQHRLNIFNSNNKTQQIEAAYKKIISNRMKGKPDRHIDVNYLSK